MEAVAEQTNDLDIRTMSAEKLAKICKSFQFWIFYLLLNFSVAFLYKTKKGKMCFVLNGNKYYHEQRSGYFYCGFKGWVIKSLAQNCLMLKS